MRLTPAGRRLAGHAVTILAAIEAARRDLDPAAPPAGTVRVAAFASAFRQVLLPVARILAGGSRRSGCTCSSRSRPRRWACSRRTRWTSC